MFLLFYNNFYCFGSSLLILTFTLQGRWKQIHIGGAEKGGAMGISDRISRGVRGYSPPEIFEI